VPPSPESTVRRRVDTGYQKSGPVSLQQAAWGRDRVGRNFNREKKMKSFSKLIAASAVAISALALFAIAPASAGPNEFCRTDGGGVRGCSYSSMEACQITSSGRGGVCSRDPVYKDPKDALASMARHPAKH